MGYFDGLTDAIFKKDASGNNTLFYPWGILGSGYIIDSEERKNQIRSLIKRTYLIMLPAIIIIHITAGPWGVLPFLLIFTIWYIWATKRITKTLALSTEKLRIGEAYKNSARSHNLAILILLELGSIVFVALAAFLLVKSNENAFIGYAGVIFWTLCALAIGYMIWAKIKKA